MLSQFKSTRYMQYVASITVTISSALAGMSTSWPSPTLPILQSADSPTGNPISDEDGSWIVSTFYLSSIPIPLIVGWVIDKFGRKKILLSSAILALIQWIVIIFATSIEMIIIARCFAGASFVMCVMTSSIYIGEITEEDIRGKLSTYLILQKILGSLIIFGVGPYVSYQVLGIICASLPVVFFGSFYFMPESPYYLMKKGDSEAAKKNLIVLSSDSADDKFIEDRMDLVRRTVEANMTSNSRFWDVFKKEYRFALFVFFGIKTLQSFSGHTALDAYLQTIIELTDSGLTPEISSIIIGCIQIPAIFLSGLLVDKLGRRPLLILSAFGSAIALFGEGTYFYIQDYIDGDTSNLAWLPTTAAAFFWIMNPLGIGPLPFVLMGEMFPSNIKGFAVGLAFTYGNVSTFLVSKFFKPLSNAIGIYTVFYIFTGISVAGAVFVFVFLPETKGKSLNEIQEMMTKRKKENSTMDTDLS